MVVRCGNDFIAKSACITTIKLPFDMEELEQEAERLERKVCDGDNQGCKTNSAADGAGGYNVRPVSRGQQDGFSAGRQDVLCPRDQKGNAPGNEHSIIANRR